VQGGTAGSAFHRSAIPPRRLSKHVRHPMQRILPHLLRCSTLRLLPSSVFHLLLRPPPDRGVIALDFCAPGKPGSLSPLGNGRRIRVVPPPVSRTTRISTRSSTVSWRTRRIGRIRRFIAASPLGCILPVGGVAAMNRNRPAKGPESNRRNQAERHDCQSVKGGAHRLQVEAECVALFRPTLAGRRRPLSFRLFSSSKN
jgi:hypothetical protein